MTNGVTAVGTADAVEVERQPARRILYVQTDRTESDIMLVENFS